MEIIEIKRVGELPSGENNCGKSWVMPGSQEAAEKLRPEKIYHLRWWHKDKDKLKIANWWFVDVEELNGKHEHRRIVEDDHCAGAGAVAGDRLAVEIPSGGEEGETELAGAL